MIEINPRSPVPVYRQLVDALKAQIESGELEAGELIPSETELEQLTGLARGTIRKAIGVLREDGFIVTTPGKGSYVAERPKPKQKDAPPSGKE